MFALLLERSKRIQALDTLTALVEQKISSRMSTALKRTKLSETRPSHDEWDAIYGLCEADEEFISWLEVVRATLPKPHFHARKTLKRAELLEHCNGLLPYIANIIVMAEHHGRTEEATAFRQVHFFVNEQINFFLWEKGAPHDQLFFSPGPKDTNHDEALAPLASEPIAHQTTEDAGLSIFRPRPELKLAASSDDNDLDVPEFMQPDFEPEPTPA